MLHVRSKQNYGVKRRMMTWGKDLFHMAKQQKYEGNS